MWSQKRVAARLPAQIAFPRPGLSLGPMQTFPYPAIGPSKLLIFQYPSHRNPGYGFNLVHVPMSQGALLESRSVQCHLNVHPKWSEKHQKPEFRVFPKWQSVAITNIVMLDHQVEGIPLSSRAGILGSWPSLARRYAADVHIRM